MEQQQERLAAALACAHGVQPAGLAWEVDKGQQGTGCVRWGEQQVHFQGKCNSKTSAIPRQVQFQVIEQRRACSHTCVRVAGVAGHAIISVAIRKNNDLQ